MHQQAKIESLYNITLEGNSMLEQNINDIGICYNDMRRNWQKG